VVFSSRWAKVCKYYERDGQAAWPGWLDSRLCFLDEDQVLTAELAILQ
jgi:hypothetical protein